MTRPQTEKNSGYDSQQFTVAKQLDDILYLQSIGRYCKCGCQKHITGRKDRKFFNPQCRTRYYYSQVGHQESKDHIDARLHMEIIGDKSVYRVLTLYFGNRKVHDIKLVPEDKNLWAQLDRIGKYRGKIGTQKLVAHK